MAKRRAAQEGPRRRTNPNVLYYIRDPQFRNRDANVEDAWGKLVALHLKEADILNLFSAAFSFVHASDDQGSAAWVNKGKELPEHTEFKKNLPAAQLREIQQAEADRKKWSGPLGRNKVQKLKRALLDFERHVVDAEGSPTLYHMLGPAAIGVLKNPDFRDGLSRLVSAFNAPGGTSQAQLILHLRKNALAQMTAITMGASGKAHWDLLADVIGVVSEERLRLTGTALRLLDKRTL